MNPSIADNTAQVAKTTVEALKQTPMVLALVIFNIMFMLMVGYLSLKSNARWEQENERMHALVAACLGKFQLQSDESKPAELKPP